MNVRAEVSEARCVGVDQRKCRGRLGLELGVFGNCGYLTMEVSHELGEGRVRTSDGGRRL